MTDSPLVPAPVLPGSPTAMFNSLIPTLRSNRSPTGSGFESPTAHAMSAEPLPQPTKDIERELERGQEDLRNTREEALAARYSLQIQRAELSGIREKTGTSEGIFMSRLRQYLQFQGLELPVEIERVYDEVGQLRESLGTLEASYTEAEDYYNLLEWRYTQKETKFFKKLSGADSERESRSEAEQLLIETGEATRFADGPNEIPNMHFAGDNAYLPVFDDYSPSGSESAASEQRNLRGLQTHTPTHHSIGDVYDDHCGDLPSGVRRKSDLSVPSTSYSERATVHAHKSLARTQEEIDSWILGTVICSHYQRSLLRNIFTKTKMTHAAWWRLALHYWSVDCFNGDPAGFHDALLPSPHIAASIGQSSLGSALFEGRPTSEILENTRAPSQRDLNTEPKEMTTQISSNLNFHDLEISSKDDNNTVPCGCGDCSASFTCPFKAVDLNEVSRINSGGTTDTRDHHSENRRAMPSEATAAFQPQPSVIQPAAAQTYHLNDAPMLSINRIRMGGEVSDDLIHRFRARNLTRSGRSKSDPGEKTTADRDQTQTLREMEVMGPYKLRILEPENITRHRTDLLDATVSQPVSNPSMPVFLGSNSSTQDVFRYHYRSFSEQLVRISNHTISI
ncbi:uncharacterized protein BDR25DRAFT_372051, partial [Lindgomyces ingoldianus]